MLYLTFVAPGQGSRSSLDACSTHVLASACLQRTWSQLFCHTPTSKAISNLRVPEVEDSTCRRVSGNGGETDRPASALRAFTKGAPFHLIVAGQILCATPTPSAPEQKTDLRHHAPSLSCLSQRCQHVCSRVARLRYPRPPHQGQETLPSTRSSALAHPPFRLLPL